MQNIHYKKFQIKKKNVTTSWKKLNYVVKKCMYIQVHGEILHGHINIFMYDIFFFTNSGRFKFLIFVNWSFVHKSDIALTVIRIQWRFSFRSHELMSPKLLLSKFAVLWSNVLLKLLTYYLPSAESIEISHNSCHERTFLQIINVSNLKPSWKSSWCMPKYKNF